MSSHEEQVKCSDCEGTGIIDEDIMPETGSVVPIKCTTCNGTGHVWITIWSSEDAHEEVS